MISNDFIYDKDENNWTKENFKHFIGNNNGKIVTPLCILAPEMSEYVNCFKESKYIYPFNQNNQFLEKYNKIWNEISNTIQKRFDNELMYNEQYL